MRRDKQVKLPRDVSHMVIDSWLENRMSGEQFVGHWKKGFIPDTYFIVDCVSECYALKRRYCIIIIDIRRY